MRTPRAVSLSRWASVGSKVPFVNNVTSALQSGSSSA
jgi:hypothetical protein